MNVWMIIFRWHQKGMGKGYCVLLTEQTIGSHGQALVIGAKQYWDSSLQPLKLGRRLYGEKNL